MKHRPLALRPLVLLLAIATLVLTACSSPSQPTHIPTIAIINYIPAFDVVVDGFKAGMADAGFVEGKSIAYAYDGAITNDNNVIDQEIQKLISQNPDIMLTVGSVASSRVKDALQKANKPGVFVSVSQPDKLGLVQDLRKPGGKMTGVLTGGPITTKAMEWLVTVAPSVKRVHVYYRHGDVTAPTQFAALQTTADKLKIELVLHESANAEEVIAALPTLTRGEDAILQIPLAFLSPAQQTAYLQEARQRGIPVGSTQAGGAASGLLTGIGIDTTQMGKQAARFAQQVIHGADPATLPVEPVQFTVEVNLATATELGLTVPDSVLQQADKVVRTIATPQATVQPTAQATSSR